MKKPFQVGDRVRVRGTTTRGRIVHVDSTDSTARVSLDDDPARIWKPLECLIRLVRKRRRRIYVDPEVISRVDLAHTAISEAGIDTGGKLGKSRGWLEFVEVKREP